MSSAYNDTTLLEYTFTYLTNSLLFKVCVIENKKTVGTLPYSLAGLLTVVITYLFVFVFEVLVQLVDALECFGNLRSEWSQYVDKSLIWRYLFQLHLRKYCRVTVTLKWTYTCQFHLLFVQDHWLLRRVDVGLVLDHDEGNLAHSLFVFLRRGFGTSFAPSSRSCRHRFLLALQLFLVALNETFELNLTFNELGKLVKFCIHQGNLALIDELEMLNLTLVLKTVSVVSLKPLLIACLRAARL